MGLSYKKLEEKLLRLEIENAEMRDRLIDMGDEDWLEQNKKWLTLNKVVYDTPNNMELGKKIRSMVNDEDN